MSALPPKPAKLPYPAKKCGCGSRQWRYREPLLYSSKGKPWWMEGEWICAACHPAVS